jgi:hypothetical protein
LTASEKRAKAVALAKSRLRKNKYTNGSNRGYVWGKPAGTDPGYSDCSSFVRAVLKKAAGIDIGGHTGTQIENRKRGLLIEDNRDGARTFPTPAKLLPGDCIYYMGTPSHAWHVGHVEMALSKSKCIGHGSGTGPTIKNIKSYSRSRTGARRYLCVIRWILDEESEAVPETPAPAPVPEKNGLRVMAGRTVNIRTGPASTYPIAVTAKGGEVLTPVDAAGWLPVLADGMVLWVSGKYVEEV